MKNFIFGRFLFIFALLLSALSASAQTGLVISQVYGGGGNSGGTYANDFIELYNSTNATINLGGFSVQYASATGSTWNAATLPAFNLAAGHYYLIEAAAGGATAMSLPTPDLILTLGPPSNVSSTFLINLAAGAGKVALVTNTTPLTTTCPTGPTILDFVGYGTTANCSEGNAPAPTTTANTQSILRTVSSVDTNNNAADFTTITPPNPRNSAFVAGNSITASGSGTPGVLTSGTTTLLTVAVTPATTPPSAGLAVQADLTLIGGSATQTLYDDGTHGDVTAGDNTFSFSTTATTASSGVVSLPVTITDAQTRTANANISLTVNLPVPVVTIPQIQGVKSTTALSVSPMAGQQVTTTGIVTTVLSNGFFIQSQVDDGNPLTPEGVEVFTSSAPPMASVVIGNLVQVTGTVSTFPAVTASHTPATEITRPTITVLSTGNALPAPVALTAAMLTPGGGLYQLTPYEGMRVSVSSLTAVSGTNGSITSANEPSEMATSTGYFYAVITGTARPFREPGIDIRDTPIPGAPTGIAAFDDNPERILVDSTIAKGTSIEISTGAVLANVTGVLDFTFSSDSFYDPSRLILDASYNRSNVTDGMKQPQAVPKQAATEFTVASFNIERFYNTSSADDLYYVPAGVNGFNGSSSTPTLSTGKTFISEAVDVSSAAYARRLQKVSLAILNILNAPDIVTLEEVENQSVANDIANQINTDPQNKNHDTYTAYSTDNSAFYSQDGTGISVGFLVKDSTVDKLNVTQFGQGESFTPTGASTPITLNDRPWLVLNAGVKRAGAKDYPVTVIVNHMKALTGVNSTTSTSTRQKKELQAEDIAKYIQTLQAQGQHVISGGDFNAFEFSDGYTDTLATYTNTNVLAATKVVQPGVAGLVTPPLVDLALLLPANQRYSYSEDGDAQILDHIVVTPELVTGGAHMAYAHLDADFPATAYNDATTAARTSDHDAAVGYFTLPAPVAAATLSPTSATLPSTIIGGTSSGQVFILTNTGETALTVASVAATGAFSTTSGCGSSLGIGASCNINVVFKPIATGAQTGQLQVVTSASATPLTSNLTGTGLVAPDFAIGDSSGKTSTAATTTAGTPATVALTLTPNSTFNGTVTLSCAIVTGAAPTGVTCTAPAPVVVNGSAVTQNVVFATTSRVTTSGLALIPGGSPWTATIVLGLAGLLMYVVGRGGYVGRSVIRMAGLLTLLLAVCIPGIGCGSSNSKSNPNGTPAGTYTYTVTATSGATAHTETVTLTVQ